MTSKPLTRYSKPYAPSEYEIQATEAARKLSATDLKWGISSGLAQCCRIDAAPADWMFLGCSNGRASAIVCEGYDIELVFHGIGDLLCNGQVFLFHLPVLPEKSDGLPCGIQDQLFG